MKIFLLLLISIFCMFNCFGQNDCIKNRDKFLVFLFRNANVEGSVECDHTGGTIIELFKIKDSIEIKNLYISCEGYDIAINKFLRKKLNKVYKDSISASCKIIIPFYFNYRVDTVISEPSQKIKEDMATVTKKYASSKYVLLDTQIYNQGAPIIDHVIPPSIVPIKQKDDPKVQVSDTTGDDQ